MKQKLPKSKERFWRVIMKISNSHKEIYKRKKHIYIQLLLCYKRTRIQLHER